MSGVKGMRHYGAQIIESVLNLREEGGDKTISDSSALLKRIFDQYIM